MSKAFDRIRVTVADLEEAIGQFQALLGAKAWPDESIPDTAWVGLPNTVLELVEVPGATAAISGLVISDHQAGREAEPVSNHSGLDLARCDGSASAQFRDEQAGAQSPGLRVDHLVLRTADAEACVELFSRQLGIRLALDKTVPEWGGRMLFFRAGKLTLEVIESDQSAPGSDHFWGIAFQCDDIDREVSRLRSAGVEITEVRAGRKPGTRVATVKSHCLGIPTLLIEPVSA
jgi:catechol 2,3-dioxygenase-like lactoylglutathione lyase family enzyme